MIRPVKRPSELRGALASEQDEREPSATELLREEREKDNNKKTDEKHGLSEQDG